MENYYIKQNPYEEEIVLIFSNSEPHYRAVYNELNTNVIIINAQEYDFAGGIQDMGNSFEESIEFITNYMEEKGLTKVSTIGEGDGLYPAILYGVVLNADILGFTPKSLLTEQDGMYAIDSTIHQAIADHQGKIALIVSDSDPEDLYAAQIFKAIKLCKFISFRRIRQPLAAELAKRNRLTPLIHEFMKGKNFTGLIDVSKSVSSPKYTEHYFLAHKAFNNEDYAACLAEAELAIDHYPYADPIHDLKANAHLKLSQLREAANHFAIVAILLPSNVEPAFKYANLLKRTNDVNLAIDLHKQNKQRWPKHANTVYDIGLCYLMKKNTKLAISYIKEASKMQPKNATFAKRLDSLVSD